jgi:hypothetical protein
MADRRNVTDERVTRRSRSRSRGPHSTRLCSAARSRSRSPVRDRSRSRSRERPGRRRHEHHGSRSESDTRPNSQRVKYCMRRTCWLSLQAILPYANCATWDGTNRSTMTEHNVVRNPHGLVTVTTACAASRPIHSRSSRFYRARICHATEWIARNASSPSRSLLDLQAWSELMVRSAVRSIYGTTWCRPRKLFSGFKEWIRRGPADCWWFLIRGSHSIGGELPREVSLHTFAQLSGNCTDTPVRPPDQHGAPSRVSD